jgi:hypothetical protein
VVCGLASLQPVSMADWGAVISVSRHMTQTVLTGKKTRRVCLVR